MKVFLGKQSNREQQRGKKSMPSLAGGTLKMLLVLEIQISTSTQQRPVCALYCDAATLWLEKKQTIGKRCFE